MKKTKAKETDTQPVYKLSMKTGTDVYEAFADTLLEGLNALKIERIKMDGDLTVSFAGKEIIQNFKMPVLRRFLINPIVRQIWAVRLENRLK